MDDQFSESLSENEDSQVTETEPVVTHDDSSAAESGSGDTSTPADSGAQDTSDLDWLLERSSQYETENAELKRRLAHYERSGSSQSRVEQTATRQAVAQNPQKAGETREDWENRIENIVQARLDAALKPLNERTEAAERRAESSDSIRKTDDIIKNSDRLVDYYANMKGGALSGKPKLAAKIKEDLRDAMREWRADNGVAADRANVPDDFYFKHANRIIQKEIAKYAFYKGLDQAEAAATATARAPGARVPSSGGSPPRTASASSGAKQSRPKMGSPEDIEDDEDWFRKNGARFNIKKF